MILRIMCKLSSIHNQTELEQWQKYFRCLHQNFSFVCQFSAASFIPCTLRVILPSSTNIYSLESLVGTRSICLFLKQDGAFFGIWRDRRIITKCVTMIEYSIRNYPTIFLLAYRMVLNSVTSTTEINFFFNKVKATSFSWQNCGIF